MLSQCCSCSCQPHLHFISAKLGHAKQKSSAKDSAGDTHRGGEENKQEWEQDNGSAGHCCMKQTSAASSPQCDSLPMDSLTNIPILCWSNASLDTAMSLSFRWALPGGYQICWCWCWHLLTALAWLGHCWDINPVEGMHLQPRLLRGRGRCVRLHQCAFCWHRQTPCSCREQLSTGPGVWARNHPAAFSSAEQLCSLLLKTATDSRYSQSLCLSLQRPQQCPGEALVYNPVCGTSRERLGVTAAARKRHCLIPRAFELPCQSPLCFLLLTERASEGVDGYVGRGGGRAEKQRALRLPAQQEKQEGDAGDINSNDSQRETGKVLCMTFQFFLPLPVHSVTLKAVSWKDIFAQSAAAFNVSQLQWEQEGRWATTRSVLGPAQCPRRKQ